jgi:hypothetical protein
MSLGREQWLEMGLDNAEWMLFERDGRAMTIKDVGICGAGSDCETV